MANKQQVLDLHHQHPDWSCQRIAAEIGAGREYVYSTFRRLGIKPPRGYPPIDPAVLRAKAARLIAQAEKLEATCRRCGGEMQPGIAMGQTYTAGAPDFPRDREGVTMSAGGPGVVIEARKCSACGHSVTPP